MNQTILPQELEASLDPDHIVFSIYEFVDSLENHYFEEIKPLVDTGILYDEELELDKLMLQEITVLVKEEINRLNDEIEQSTVKKTRCSKTQASPIEETPSKSE